MPSSYLAAITLAGQRVDGQRVPYETRHREVWPNAQTWNSDEAPDLLPPGVWSEMQGVRVIDGGLERIADAEHVMGATNGAGNQFAMFSDDGAVPYWFSQGPAGWMRSDGTTGQALTGGYAVADQSRLTGIVFNGFPIINDPTRAPYYYPLAGTAVAVLPGWQNGADSDPTWRCQAMRSFREHLIAINLTENGTALTDRVRWSDQALSGAMPQAWLPMADNLAGVVDLSGEQGRLVDGGGLGGDAFTLFKPTATYLMDYIGAPYVFRVRKLSVVSGCLDVNCVASTPLGQVVVTPTDIVLVTGQQVQSIVHSRLRRWIFRALDPLETKWVSVTTHILRNEVVFTMPIAGHLNDPAPGAREVLIWNWTRDEWAFRQLPRAAVNVAVGTIPPATQRPPSWDADSEAWNNDPTPWTTPNVGGYDQLVYGDPSDSKWVALDRTNDAGGDLGETALNGWGRFVRYSWTLGDARAAKTITGFVPRFNSARSYGTIPETLVRFGVQDHLQDQIAWSPQYTVRESAGQRRIDIPSEEQPRGNFVSVEVELRSNAGWIFEGFALEFRAGGDYTPPRATVAPR